MCYNTFCFMQKKVRKVALASSGFGTRFMPITSNLPKEMFPIIDKPIFQYVLEEILVEGIEELVLIVSKAKKILLDYIKDSPDKDFQNLLKKIKITVTYRKPSLLGNGAPILSAKKYLKDGPFFVAWADSFALRKDNRVVDILKAYKKLQRPIVGLLPITERARYIWAVPKVERISRNKVIVKRLYEKPARKKLMSDFAFANGYLLEPDIFNYLERTKPRENREIVLEDAIDAYCRENLTYGVVFRKPFFEAGNKIDYVGSSLKLLRYRKELRSGYFQILKEIQKENLLKKHSKVAKPPKGLDVEYLLYANTKGWRDKDIKISISKDSKITEDLKQARRARTKVKKQLEKAFQFTKEKRPNDFNGLKVSIQKISTNKNGNVNISARVTDYFTLWGIPGATPDLLKKSNREFISAKTSKIPCGLYTANIVITSDEKTIMAVISQSGGFGAGRLSFGFEEQMEIDDVSLVQTVVRGFKEEIGSNISKKNVRILGFGKSLDIAYIAAYCVVKTELTSREVLKNKEAAADKNEASTTLVVPIHEIGNLCREKVPFKTIRKYAIDKGKLGKGDGFLLHHRANWLRWILLKDYLEI